MEDVDITLQPSKLFKDNSPLRLSDNLAVSWCHICHVPAGMRELDWHSPPQRLLVLNLTAEVEYETSDGDIRRAAAGSVVLAEDMTGKTGMAPSSGMSVENSLRSRSVFIAQIPRCCCRSSR